MARDHARTATPSKATLFALASAASAESTGRIAGRVMVEGTNTAVAGARIILLPTARRFQCLLSQPVAISAEPFA